MVVGVSDSTAANDSMDKSQNKEFDATASPVSQTSHSDGEILKPAVYHGSESGSSDEQGRRPRPWKTTFIRFGPLSGIFATLLALGCIFASLGILAGSNGATVRSWSTPPSTYLAICTAVANLAMRYACIQGVVIAWWIRALRGTTLAKLHWTWREGSTLRGAITAGRHTGLLGLACIFSIVVVVDGPLLQRASTVIPVPIVDSTLLNVTISPEVPRGYTGGWFNSSLIHQRWSLLWNDTTPTSYGTVRNNIYSQGGQNADDGWARAWFSNAPMSGFVQGCPGQCKAKILAPALSVRECKTRKIAINYQHPGFYPVDASNTYLHAAPLSQAGFMIDISLLIDQNREAINLITGHTETQTCNNTFAYTACTLDSAVGEYGVEISNNVITIDPGLPKIMSLANNTEVASSNDLSGLPTAGKNGSTWHPAALGGIVAFSLENWQSEVSYYDNGNEINRATIGTTFQRFLSRKPPTASTRGTCESYSDPQLEVLQSLNKLMVYTGIFSVSTDNVQDRIDPRLRINTTYTAQIQGSHNVFHTNYHFWIAAAVVEIVCIALILPTYWGWWTLGRPVSFSPLEIAKAFDAPILVDQDPNASGRDLANSTAHVPVQYGATIVNPADGRATLTFGHPDIVHSPAKKGTAGFTSTVFSDH